MQSVAGITKAIGDSPLQLSPRQEGAEVIVPVPKCVSPPYLLPGLTLY